MLPMEADFLRKEHKMCIELGQLLHACTFWMTG